MNEPTRDERHCTCARLRLKSLMGLTEEQIGERLNAWLRETADGGCALCDADSPGAAP